MSPDTAVTDSLESLAPLLLFPLKLYICTVFVLSSKLFLQPCHSGWPSVMQCHLRLFGCNHLVCFYLLALRRCTCYQLQVMPLPSFEDSSHVLGCDSLEA